MRPLALTNGDVRTIDAAGTIARAILLVDGRVARTGSVEEILGAAPAEARIVDVGGRTVLPGLIDAHAHLVSLGVIGRIVDTRYPQVGSIAELVAAVAARASREPAGAWVRGRLLPTKRNVPRRLKRIFQNLRDILTP